MNLKLKRQKKTQSDIGCKKIQQKQNHEATLRRQYNNTTYFGIYSRKSEKWFLHHHAKKISEGLQKKKSEHCLHEMQIASNFNSEDSSSEHKSKELERQNTRRRKFGSQSDKTGKRALNQN